MKIYRRLEFDEAKLRTRVSYRCDGRGPWQTTEADVRALRLVRRSPIVIDKYIPYSINKKRIAAFWDAAKAEGIQNTALCRGHAQRAARLLMRYADKKSIDS